MIQYEHDEKLYYNKQSVLFHHHQGNDTHSIVYFVVDTVEEIDKFRSHLEYFTEAYNNVYFRVLTEELSRLSPVYTNREAVFLLTEEE